MQAVTETDARHAVVEHGPACKLRSANIPELAKTAKVRLRDRRARLDLDSGYEAALLHDDVDLDLVLVSIVEELHLPAVPASLPAQFLEDERFEELPQQRTVREERPHGRAKQRARQSRIADVNLRGLDEAFPSIVVPRRQRLQEVHSLHERDVTADRRPAKLERPRQVAQVEQTRGLRRRHGEKPWQYVQAADAGQGADVPLHLSVDVVPVPVGAPATCGPGKGGRVSSRNDPLGQLRPQTLNLPDRQVIPEQGVDEAGGGAARLQLALRQRVQSNRLHAAGEGVLHGRDSQHVCRAGEDEPARSPPPVDFELQGREELLYALHLVQNDTLRKISHEAHGIGCGPGADNVVVETEVTVTPARGPARRGSAREEFRRARHLRKRRLPALARTLDQDDG